MMQFLGNWEFWISVILVTFIAHWVFTKFLGNMTSGGNQS